MYQDYYVDFFKDGVVYEDEIYLGPSEIPFSGNKLFVISRIWSHERRNDEIISNMKWIWVMIYDSSFIPLFNESNFCNHSKLKVNKMIDCNGKNIFGYAPLEGQRSINQFKMKDDKLHLVNSSKEEIIPEKFSPHNLSWISIR